MRVIIGVSVVLIATSAWGQQLYIYPQRGQSFDQQAVDKAECQRWANQQTGYNPAAPPPPPMAGAPQGGMFRGAAGGAALGAVGGAIGGDAGKGAAIGAGVGALFGGFRRMRAMEEEQAQMASYQAQTGQATANFNRAYSACLQGRGYTVQ
ncbi:MAG: glycine zipper family protein [Candidatus Rokuibacteriota bacterium]|nr:MAG: glycine zipper family protein [Candidatus Rokubacteria bacterium]